MLSASLAFVRYPLTKPLRLHQPIELRLDIQNRSKFVSKSPMVKVRLAPGMTPMRSDLDKLVRHHLVRRDEIYEGRVVLYLPALRPGKELLFDFRVVPTLSGTMSTGLSRVYDYYYPEGETLIPSQTITIR